MYHWFDLENEVNGPEKYMDQIIWTIVFQYKI